MLRPYRRQMSSTQELNFASQDVHHTLVSAAVVWDYFLLCFSNSTSCYLCLTTTVSQRVTTKRIYNTDCLLVFTPAPTTTNDPVSTLLRSVKARAHCYASPTNVSSFYSNKCYKTFYKFFYFLTVNWFVELVNIKVFLFFFWHCQLLLWLITLKQKYNVINHLVG